MNKKPAKKETVTLTQVCEAMADFVRKERRFPTPYYLRKHMEEVMGLQISSTLMTKYFERAKNISFTDGIEDTRAYMLTPQVIINLFEQTFHNVKAVELWLELFGVPKLSEVGTKQIDSDENILEVRYIDATKAE